MIIKRIDINSIEYLKAKERVLRYKNCDFIIDNKCVYNYIIMDNETILGEIDFMYIRPQAEILFFYIDEKFRRQGLATYLFKETVKILDRLGLEKIFLDVRENNIAAYNLYKKLGFTEIGKRTNYYENGEDAIEMMLVHKEDIC